jgi:uncharacterized short protein YbdD (DUF466 family)
MNGNRVNRWSMLWEGLRSLTGDNSYERYVKHLAAHHPAECPLSRANFYASELEQRWNRDGPTRCC